MHVRRSFEAGLLAVLSLFFIASSWAQDAAPAKVVINARLDEASRSLLLDPIGVSVKLPANLLISSFRSGPDTVDLDANLPGGGTMLLSIRFWLSPDNPGKCYGQLGALGASTKGGAYSDERWYGELQSNDWITLCLETPNGAVFVDSTPLKREPREPLVAFSASMADALLPGSAKPAAAVEATAAPAAPAVTSVTGVYPLYALDTLSTCQDESLGEAGAFLREVSCEAYSSFQGIHDVCNSTNDAVNARMCISIADRAADEDDYANAAVFYQRACDLGESGACRKAERSAERAGR